MDHHIGTNGVVHELTIIQNGIETHSLLWGLFDKSASSWQCGRDHSVGWPAQGGGATHTLLWRSLIQFEAGVLELNEWFWKAESTELFVATLPSRNSATRNKKGEVDFWQLWNIINWLSTCIYDKVNCHHNFPLTVFTSGATAVVCITIKF